MKRAADLRELMDDPGADLAGLNRTYRHFVFINRWLTGWAGVYRRMLRARMDTTQPVRILDIGAGGGDLLGALHAWTQRDGIAAALCGIDPDPRAAAYFADSPCADLARYHGCDTRSFLDQQERFDIVISNHLLHHLPPDEVVALCRDAQKLSSRCVVFNDIHRGRFAYLLYRTFAPLVLRNSFAGEDGARSIRRAYTAKELRAIVPTGWRVKRLLPFRLLVIYEH